MAERRAANAKDHALCPACGARLHCNICGADITHDDLAGLRVLDALEDLRAMVDLLPSGPRPLGWRSTLERSSRLLAELGREVDA